MTKTFNIVMLPTNQKVNFACGLQPNGVLKYCSSLSDLGIGKPQHIYILSDEEIKDGDWLIGGANDESENEVWKHDGLGYISKEDKKIVATTDKSLSSKKHHSDGDMTDLEYQLPQLPESFIQTYIKAYNEGKPITEVDLEMELEESEETKKWFEDKLGKSLPDLEYIIKTRPDNTVIIKEYR